MSLFFRQGIPEAPYGKWKDVFDPYLMGLYETMGRFLSSGGVLQPHHRVSYEAFCFFVYQYSSKHIPEIFLKELDERLSQEIRNLST